MNKYYGDDLIFLISQPRAGSTLLQRLCAKHISIATSAEPWIMLHPVYAIREDGLNAQYNARHANNALHDFLEYNCDGIETYYESVREMARVLYGKAINNSGKQLFLDKTPRYYFIIKELYSIFPNAKFIFLLRNPLSILYSILSTWANGYWMQLNRNRYDLLLAPDLILNGIDYLSDKAIVVHYEDLIETPHATLSKVLKYLGFSDIHKVDTDYTSVNVQGRMGDEVGIYKVNRPINDSLNKWHNLNETIQTRHFAQEYLKLLGESTVTKLGYNFKELTEIVYNIRISNREIIVPFSMALKSIEELSPTQMKYVNRVIAYQKAKQSPNKGYATIWNATIANVLKMLI